jgi:dihydroorotase
VSLTIVNGRIIDPASNTAAQRDIVISAGRISSIGGPKSPQTGDLFDASGLLVVPGLIDMHTHVYAGPTELGIAPDIVGVSRGVTTVIDAGSSGSENLAAFRSSTIDSAQTRVLAFINLARTGLERPRYEISSREFWSTSEEIFAAAQDPTVRGMKARASATAVGPLGIEPIKRAKELALHVNLPLMVHVGNAPPLFTDVLNLLTRGDIVTHCFHGKPGGILDERGQIIPEAIQARERGVLFDIGHGTSSFNFAVAEKACGQGFFPDLCGTDVYLQNVQGPVYDLPTTLSKMLALGISLVDVIRLATISAANALKMEDELGTLEVGRQADLSILRLVNEQRAVTDSDGNTKIMKQFLKPVAVVRAGNLLRCGE